MGLHSTARSAPESQLSEDSFLVVAYSMGFLIKAAARRLYRLESCGDAGPKSLLQGGGRPRMLRPANASAPGPYLRLLRLRSALVERPGF